MNQTELKEKLVEVDKRVAAVEKILPTLLTRQEFKIAMSAVDGRFDAVDQRFEQIDRRFEQIDRRFEQVDRRFEQVEQRFEQIDRRFDQVDQKFFELSVAMKTWADDLRHHFNIVSESLRSDIRLIAKGHRALVERLDRVDPPANGAGRSKLSDRPKPAARSRKRSK